MPDKMQEEFENWFSRTYPLTNRESTQSEILCKMIAEQVWRASREMLVDSLPKRREPYYGKVGYGPYGEGWNECLDVVEGILKGIPEARWSNPIRGRWSTECPNPQNIPKGDENA